MSAGGPGAGLPGTGGVPVLEIGGTHVTAALVDPAAGRVLAGSRRRALLDAQAPADVVLGTVLDCAAGLSVTAGTRWGVAVPGPFDYARGIARFTGVGKFDALFGVDVRRALLDGLPAGSRVTFVNDAHAFALGEWSAGAARGHDRVVGITLGTGVGSAFLAGGTVVGEGPDVPPQGYVHLLRIDGEPLEETVSRRAILARHAELTGGARHSGLDVRDIAELARGGDRAARRTLEDALGALGAALRPWTLRFRPTVVVVGGAVAGSWDLVGPALRAGLDRPPGGAARPAPGAVVRAHHLADAALLGAAWQTLTHRPDPGSGAPGG